MILQFLNFARKSKERGGMGDDAAKKKGYG